MLHRSIMLRAIRLHGKESQLRKTQEELGELIVAINHFLENREGSDHEIHEELADALIMLWQCRLMCNASTLDRYIDEKLDRLDKRLDAMEFPENE